MESLSKITVPRHVLEDIMQDCLGQVLAGAEEITHGWYNTIWKLSGTSGQSVVLKISPRPGFTAMRYEKDLIHSEVRVLDILAREGIPVPAVLARRDSFPGIDHPFFLMEFLPGTTWAQARKELQDAGSGPAVIHGTEMEKGRLNARVNRCGPRHAPRGRFGLLASDTHGSSTWPEAFFGMMEDLLADARDTGTVLPVSDHALRELLVPHREILDRVRIPSLVLWDLHDGNLMAEGAHLRGILDCDRALWGDPLMECWFRGLWGRSEGFVEGWAREMDPALCPGLEGSTPAEFACSLDTPGHPVAIRSALYDLHLSLTMQVECAFRGYEGGHRTWAEGLVKECLVRLDRMVSS